MITKKQQAAVKRIIKNTCFEKLKGVYIDDDGRATVCDGFQSIKFYNAVEGLPTCSGARMQSFFNEAQKNNNLPLLLPSVAELKEYIKTTAAADKKNKIIFYDFGEGAPLVNAKYLLNMLEALPGCTAKIKNNMSALYFEANSGAGLLLPVRRA